VAGGVVVQGSSDTEGSATPVPGSVIRHTKADPSWASPIVVNPSAMSAS
jgi:hypothetical protein